MKKILIGMLVMFLIVTTISSAVLGYFLIMKNNEVVALLNKAPVTPTPSPSPTPTPVTPTTFTFEDIGQGVKVTYPTGWTHTLETKLSADFAYTPEYGKVISKYNLVFKKSDVVLTFQEILAGIDGFPSPVNKTTHDYVLVSPKLVRYSEKGKNLWKYSQKESCDSVVGTFLSAEEAAAADFCVGPFFPGFSTAAASTVQATGANADALKEADQIVLSGL